MAELLLTVAQAAERLQMNPESIRRQLRRGELRGIKRGRRFRIPESALLEAPATVAAPAPTLDELASMFDELNAEADAHTGEPLKPDFNAAIAATYAEREGEQ